MPLWGCPGTGAAHTRHGLAHTHPHSSLQSALRSSTKFDRALEISPRIAEGSHGLPRASASFHKLPRTLEACQGLPRRTMYPQQSGTGIWLSAADGRVCVTDAKHLLQGRRPENAQTGVFGDPQNICIYVVGAKDDNKKGITFLSDIKKIRERKATTKKR